MTRIITLVTRGRVPSRSKRLFGGVLLTVGASISGCQAILADPADGTVVVDLPEPAAPNSSLSLVELRVANQAQLVGEEYPQQPTVLTDTAGLSISKMFYQESDTVIVAGPGDAAQLRAASLGVFTHAPVLSYTPEKHAQVIEEINRLGAQRVVTIGRVDIASSVGTIVVFEDNGTLEGLGQMTAHEFIVTVVEDPADMVRAVAGLDGHTPIVLVPAWDDYDPQGGQPHTFPIATRRDAQFAPPVLATQDSPLAAVATARSFGAEVRLVDDPDPRQSYRTLQATTGLSDRSVIALGREFGTGADLSNAITEAEANSPELQMGD